MNVLLAYQFFTRYSLKSIPDKLLSKKIDSDDLPSGDSFFIYSCAKLPEGKSYKLIEIFFRMFRETFCSGYKLPGFTFELSEVLEIIQTFAMKGAKTEVASMSYVITHYIKNDARITNNYEEDPYPPHPQAMQNMSALERVATDENIWKAAVLDIVPDWLQAIHHYGSYAYKNPVKVALYMDMMKLLLKKSPGLDWKEMKSAYLKNWLDMDREKEEKLKRYFEESREAL